MKQVKKIKRLLREIQQNDTEQREQLHNMRTAKNLTGYQNGELEAEAIKLKEANRLLRDMVERLRDQQTHYLQYTYKAMRSVADELGIKEVQTEEGQSAVIQAVKRLKEDAADVFQLQKVLKEELDKVREENETLKSRHDYKEEAKFYDESPKRCKEELRCLESACKIKNERIARLEEENKTLKERVEDKLKRTKKTLSEKAHRLSILSGFAESVLGHIMPKPDFGHLLTQDELNAAFEKVKELAAQAHQAEAHRKCYERCKEANKQLAKKVEHFDRMEGFVSETLTEFFGEGNSKWTASVQAIDTGFYKFKEIKARIGQAERIEKSFEEKNAFIYTIMDIVGAKGGSMPGAMLEAVNKVKSAMSDLAELADFKEQAEALNRRWDEINLKDAFVSAIHTAAGVHGADKPTAESMVETANKVRAAFAPENQPPPIGQAEIMQKENEELTAFAHAILDTLEIHYRKGGIRGAMLDAITQIRAAFAPNDPNDLKPSF